MIIHFSASTRNISHDIHKYRKILNKTRQLGHSIAHDWVETAWLKTQSQGRDTEGRDLKEIVMEVESGLEMGELAIVEASNISTFGVGYELALALQKKKPTLVLVDAQVASYSYAAALAHDLLTICIYKDEASMEKGVEVFIRENTIRTKDLRFNFVIDRQIYNHLRNRSFATGKTKAELVRDLLVTDIEKDRKSNS